MKIQKYLNPVFFVFLYFLDQKFIASNRFSKMVHLKQRIDSHVVYLFKCLENKGLWELVLFPQKRVFWHFWNIFER